MAGGIDFMAIARGREQALSENFRDIQRSNRLQQQQFQLAELGREAEEQEQNRLATSYLAPLVVNMQRAAEQGVGEVDAFLQNRQAVLNDPNFQGFAPEVQSRVLNQLQDVAVGIAERQGQAGNIGDIQRIYESFGATAPINQVQQAAQSGNPRAIIEAANEQFGANISISADGQQACLPGGQCLPIDDAAFRLAQAPSAGGAAILPGIAQQRRLNTIQEVAQQQAEQRRLQQERIFGTLGNLNQQGGQQTVDASDATSVIGATAGGGTTTPGTQTSQATAQTAPQTPLNTQQRTALQDLFSDITPTTARTFLEPQLQGLQETAAELSDRRIQLQDRLNELQTARQQLLSENTNELVSTAGTPGSSPVRDAYNELLEDIASTQQAITQNDIAITDYRRNQRAPLRGQLEQLESGTVPSSVLQVVEQQVATALDQTQTAEGAASFARSSPALVSSLIRELQRQLNRNDLPEQQRAQITTSLENLRSQQNGNS